MVICTIITKIRYNRFAKIIYIIYTVIDFEKTLELGLVKTFINNFLLN